MLLKFGATEKDKERATLSTHASRISPELIVCERQLGCIIEGVGQDKLLFRFTNIDPEDHTREGSFVLDIAESAYKGSSYCHLVGLNGLMSHKSHHSIPKFTYNNCPSQSAIRLG